MTDDNDIDHARNVIRQVFGPTAWEADKESALGVILRALGALARERRVREWRQMVEADLRPLWLGARALNSLDAILDGAVTEPAAPPPLPIPPEHRRVLMVAICPRCGEPRYRIRATAEITCTHPEHHGPGTGSIPRACIEQFSEPEIDAAIDWLWEHEHGCPVGQWGDGEATP